MPSRGHFPRRLLQMVKRLMEAGKKRLAGDTARAATTDEVKDLRREANGLRMICIEDNSMSDQMRKQFGSLRGMSVFV